MKNESDSLKSFREELATRRYTVLPADVILSASDRLEIRSSVFRDGTLEPDQRGVHSQRQRADAVLRFSWRTDEDVALMLGPNDAADAEQRQIVRYTANLKDKREYKRLRALELPALVRLLQALLRLVPKKDRREHGLLGVHAFRTVRDVVFIRHRDGSAEAPVDWVGSYIVSKNGGGAESELTLDEAGRLLIAKTALTEGQLMMHHDRTYFHYVTPLTATADAPVKREALIVTVRPEFT